MNIYNQGAVVQAPPTKELVSIFERVRTKPISQQGVVQGRLSVVWSASIAAAGRRYQRPLVGEDTVSLAVPARVNVEVSDDDITIESLVECIPVVVPVRGSLVEGGPETRDGDVTYLYGEEVG